MLSGPEANHAPFWVKLREHVHTEDPEELDRFLCRHHEISECEMPDENFLEWFDPAVPGEAASDDEK